VLAKGLKQGIVVTLVVVGVFSLVLTKTLSQPETTFTTKCLHKHKGILMSNKELSGRVKIKVDSLLF
jgi:hypothetical protein